MQSLKSDALEPDLHNLPTDGFARFAALVFRSFSVYGLIFITLGLVVLFSVLLPGTFFTWLNARLIMSNQAVIALLALAAMIPMVAGKID
jgi:ribose transport system permease protein